MCIRQSNRSGNIRFIYRESTPSLWEQFIDALRTVTVAFLAAGVTIAWTGLILFLIVQAWNAVA